MQSSAIKQQQLLQLLQLLLAMLLLLMAGRADGLRFISPNGAANSDASATINMDESMPVDSTVYSIESDTDCTFTIVTGGATLCDTAQVKLSSTGGLVKTVRLELNSVMDYEAGAVRVCPVQCAPATGAARTASITVSLQNVIDLAPTPSGTATYTVTVVEEQVVGTAVQTVQFNDAEVSAIGDVLTCSLSGGGAGLFTVTSTPTTAGADCAVRTAVKIDRDTLTSDVYNSILLKATDRAGLTATVSFTITIGDINDNSPTCTNTGFAASVTEAETSGTLATIATCSDADKGINALLVYALVGTPTGVSLAGNVLSLTAAKDYDTITTNPELIYVTVSDSAASAGDRRTITTTVTLTIRGLNDNTPSLTTTTVTNTIAESAAQGVVVFSPSATDADKAGDPDSTLTWSIVAATSTAGTNVGLNIANSFSIDGSTGAVSIGTAPLDYESWTEGKVTIKVTDGGTDPSPKTATQTLTLSVTDVNESPPTFSPSNYYRVSLAENNVENFTVLNTFSASDPDASNLPVWCEIISGNTDSVFRFNATNRNILELNKRIEPDSATNHPLLFMLLVQCKDNNGTAPYKSSTATIQVDITTSNDFTPTLR